MGFIDSLYGYRNIFFYIYDEQFLWKTRRKIRTTQLLFQINQFLTKTGDRQRNYIFVKFDLESLKEIIISKK